MSIPITGVLLIPLGLLLVLMPWRHCLIGLMVYALMIPAAVVNIGSFGLQPGFYLAILMIARTAVEIAAQGFRLNGYVLSRLNLLFLFLIATVFALFIALALFQGQVDTLPGSLGFKSDALRPFRLARENFTQLAYLILNIVLVYALAHQGARENMLRLFKSWDTAVVIAIFFAVGVCAWQFLGQFGGPAFPSGFFYSNAGYGRSENQTMVGILRISGPLGEPSALGYAFTSFLLFSWMRYRLYPTALSAVLIAATGLCMVLSTSTTSFVGILVFGCLALSDVASGRIHLATRTLSSGQVAAWVIAGLVAVAALVVIAAKGPELYIIFKNVVLEKGESSSFQERSFADVQGMQILVQTYGLGIGLGSHKANSLVVTLLSNVGIAGFLLFVAFVYTILFRPPSMADNEETRQLRRAMAPFKWGVIGLIIMHAVSNPNLGTEQLWAQLGGLLALQAAIRANTTRTVHQSAIALPELGLAPAE